MEELKPCPFCGGEALINTVSNIYLEMYSVSCSGEKDSGCRCLTNQWEEAKEEAIKAWNTRKGEQ